jgi:hypothetical protein
MNQGRRIAREKETVESMMRVYCADHHGETASLCQACRELLEYAHKRLDTCPFQDAKPACNHCRVHCYSRSMRDRVKAVMRYAGPRMLLRHPLLSFYHLLDTHRKAPNLSDVKRKGSQTGKSETQQD